MPRPLSDSFEQAGIIAALDRLATDLPTLIPRWLWSCESIEAAAQLALLVPVDRNALCACVVELEGADPIEPTPQREEDSMYVLSVLRIALGTFFERLATTRWETQQANLSTIRTRQRSKRRPFNYDAQLLFDAYAAATWTSCHVEYATTASDEIPPPSIFSVPNQSIELRLSNLLDSRGFTQPVLRAMHPMQQLLVRCVNPASRGWKTSLDSIVNKHDAPRRVISDALIVCLTGLHPCLIPTARNNWRTRLVVGRRLHVTLHSKLGRKILCDSPEQTKEATRRFYAALLLDSLPIRNVAIRLGSPTARLLCPPLDTPAQGMLDSMHMLSIAGAKLIDVNMDVLSTLSRSFDPCPIQREKANVVWIGRSKQRTVRPKLLDRASDCVSESFAAEFLPFWMRATSCGSRPQRLDEAQHAGLHQHSSALAMCRSVSEQHTLRIHRIVIQNPVAPLMTIEGASMALDINAEQTDGPIERCGPSACARLLVFARIAWLCERVLIVDLGQRTKTLQIAAITRRYLFPEEAKDENTLWPPTDDELRAGLPNFEKHVEKLPTHITCLCVCTECMRIANCVPLPPSGKDEGDFCEVGVSSVTVCRRDGTSEIFCARRSSAALRSAMNTERIVRGRRVDEDDMMLDTALNELTEDVEQCATAMAAMAHDGTVASRMRRDCKRALEQRRCSALCGTTPLLTIPLLGRAVRINDAWYSMCAFCATVVRFTTHNRLESEIACLRCYGDKSRTMQDDLKLKKIQTVQCQFCGRCERAASGRFRSLHSPIDTNGENKERPPTLRYTTWCPKHNKPWLADALQVLTLPQIFAHIATNAIPCAEVCHDTLMQEPHKNPRKRRRIICKKT